MKKTVLALALVAGLTSFAGNAKAQNLIQNGNLTNYTINPGNGRSKQWIGYVSLNDWTVTGPYMNIYSGAGYLGGNSLYMGASSSGGIGDMISQNINTTIGVNYELSFYILGGDPNINNLVYADVNGMRVINIVDNNDYPNWTSLSVVFTATTTSTAIDLGSYTDANSHQVSNISVTVLPEPSTYALFGIGALALIVAYRRKSA